MASKLLTASVKSVAGHQSQIARTVDKLPQVRTNLSSPERVASLVGAGALAYLGFDGRGPGVASILASSYLVWRAATGNCVGYQLMGVSTSDSTHENTVIAAGHGTKVQHSVIVHKPVDEVYRFWRDFENLPRFMAHLEDVNTSTDGRSHWIAKGPLGMRVEWEAELIEDQPNKVISWKSLQGADVDTAGSVHFRELPGGRGTVVEVNLKYDPPAGQLGTMIAKVLGQSPDRQIRSDLRRFKQIMETGEVVTVSGQPHGPR